MKAHEMSLKYDEEIHIDKGRQQGSMHTPWMVCSLARDKDGVTTILVKAHRAFVSDEWGVDCHDDNAVEEAFRAHRDDYLKAAAQALASGKKELTIG
jgi:hypothetical protein